LPQPGSNRDGASGRKPLAAHEQPIMRTYLAVEDIQKAVKKAEDSGALIAYPRPDRDSGALLQS
jgi:hypothetical protein